MAPGPNQIKLGPDYAKIGAHKLNRLTTDLLRAALGLRSLNSLRGEVVCLKCEERFDSPDRFKIRVCSTCKGRPFWTEESEQLSYTPGLKAPRQDTSEVLSSDFLTEGEPPRAKKKVSREQQRRQFVQVRSLLRKRALKKGKK